MKKRFLLLLLLCVVVSMSAPVSADYFWYKDVNATDMVDELITYVKYNCSIVDWDWKLSRHWVYDWNETRTGHAFDLRFTCNDTFYRVLPVPLPLPERSKYKFFGEMHVKDKRELTQNYTLTITDEDRKFRADGKNWWLEVKDIDCTRFKL